MVLQTIIELRTLESSECLAKTQLFRIHPMYCHQTQTLMWMPTILAERSLIYLPPDKYRGGGSQPTIGLSIRSPMEELEKGPKELKETSAP